MNIQSVIRLTLDTLNEYPISIRLTDEYSNEYWDQ